MMFFVYMVYDGRTSTLSSNAAQPHTRAHTPLSLSLSPARSLARLRTHAALGEPLPYVSIEHRLHTSKRCVRLMVAGRWAAHNTNLTPPSVAARLDGRVTTDRCCSSTVLLLRPAVTLYALWELSLKETAATAIGSTVRARERESNVTI